jgi:hypothetical protein
MRKTVLLLPLLLLSGCRGSQLYSAQDLRQVRESWSVLQPTYLEFEQAYKRGDTSGILAGFRREQQECRVVDQVDNRDTIDPGVKLFQVSAALDDICNTIESAYVTWAKPHGYPYDKTVQPSRPAEVFIGMDQEFKNIPVLLRHPDSLS